MTESGFKHKNTFQQQKDISKVTNNTKNKKRKNEVESLDVSAKISEEFFSLLDKYFPKAHEDHNSTVIMSKLVTAFFPTSKV